MEYCDDFTLKLNPDELEYEDQLLIPSSISLVSNYAPRDYEHPCLHRREFNMFFNDSDGNIIGSWESCLRSVARMDQWDEEVLMDGIVKEQLIALDKTHMIHMADPISVIALAEVYEFPELIDFIIMHPQEFAYHLIHRDFGFIDKSNFEGCYAASL